MSEVHSGAEPVNENLCDFCRIEVRLPGQGVVDDESLRLGDVSSAVEEHVDVGRVGADQELAAVERILKDLIFFNFHSSNLRISVE